MKKSFELLLLFVLLFQVSNSLRIGNSNLKGKLSDPTVSEEEEITIEIKKEDNTNKKLVGLNGTFYFITKYNDKEKQVFDTSDIEKNTTFTSSIEYGSEENGNITCRLWKDDKEDVFLLCNINEDISEGEQTLHIDDAIIEYGNYKINIAFEKDQLFEINYLNYPIPFFYSNEQIINIEDENDTYYLTFNLGEYNNEQLYLSENGNDVILLHECKVEEQELTCQLNKKEILENMQYNNIQYIIKFQRDEYGVSETQFRNQISFTYEPTKIDIYIKITKLLDSNSDKYNTIAYETNVTDISDVFAEFTPNLFGLNPANCILKKSESTPLLLICIFSEEKTYSLGEITETMSFTNINILYNFYLEPVKNTEEFTISGTGGYLSYAYPYVLDFNINDTLKIDLKANQDIPNKNIKLNLESNELNCNSLNGWIIRCYVPISHFENKASEGYYYIHHLNHVNQYSKFYEISPIKVILPDDKEIILRINGKNNKNNTLIGINAKTIAFVTQYNDKERGIFSDPNLEKDTSFRAILRDTIIDYKYDASCRLWKPTDEIIRIICNLDKGLNSYSEYILIDKISFDYNGYHINVIQEDFIIIESKKDVDIPFLYSDTQRIDIKDEVQKYSLKFKVEYYYDDILYIYGQNENYASLDNCQHDDNNKILTCEIEKETLEGILVLNDEKFKVGTINDNIGIIELDFIMEIIVNQNISQKEDIFIKYKDFAFRITKINIPYALNTNVTSISDLISGTFKFSGATCRFINKNKNKNLLVFCTYNIAANYKIQGLSEEENYNTIHYKYNFRVQPFTFADDDVYVKGNGTNVLFSNPGKLDFNSGSKQVIRYIMPDPELEKYIKLDKDHDYLVCKNLNKLKVCDVPISHFGDYQYKNYYTLHNDPAIDIYYNIGPTQVIIPTIKLNITDDNNKDIIRVGKNYGIIYFTSDFIDENNLLNSSKLEYETTFDTFIKDDMNYQYNLTCHLWRPYDNRIRIICKLNKELNLEKSHITFHSTYFDYYNYKIFIEFEAQNIQVQKYETPVPFLYADMQEINVENDVDSYEINFKIPYIGNYNNELLEFFDKDFNEKIFDDCKRVGLEVICTLTKKEIEEILVNDGEIFNLGVLYDKYGF